MKYLIILISVLLFSFCKKDASEIYIISKTKWEYSIPKNYIYRVNHSINSNNSKDKYPFKNPEDMSENLYVLLTASKKNEVDEKWSDTNSVMATHTKAKFIKEYGSLKNYLKATKNFLDKTYSKEEIKPEIVIKEEMIADRKFDVITQNFVSFQNKSTSVSYYTIIENELFQILINYDNEEDKNEILKTIENSKFIR